MRSSIDNALRYLDRWRLAASPLMVNFSGAEMSFITGGVITEISNSEIKIEWLRGSLKISLDELRESEVGIYEPNEVRANDQEFFDEHFVIAMTIILPSENRFDLVETLESKNLVARP